MELFDIVDKQGNPTGEIVSRDKAHREGICHRTAQIWLVRTLNGTPQLLLQKRVAAKESYPNCYDTSAAGHIQAGDEPLVSALRELEEELGIRAAAGDFHFQGTHYTFERNTFHDQPFNDQEVGFVYIYAKPVNADALVLQPEEVDSVRWFDLEEIVRKVESGSPDCCVKSSGLALAVEWFRENL